MPRHTRPTGRAKHSRAHIRAARDRAIARRRDRLTGERSLRNLVARSYRVDVTSAGAAVDVTTYAVTEKPISTERAEQIEALEPRWPPRNPTRRRRRRYHHPNWKVIRGDLAGGQPILQQIARPVTWPSDRRVAAELDAFTGGPRPVVLLTGADLRSASRVLREWLGVDPPPDGMLARQLPIRARRAYYQEVEWTVPEMGRTSKRRRRDSWRDDAAAQAAGWRELADLDGRRSAGEGARRTHRRGR